MTPSYLAEPLTDTARFGRGRDGARTMATVLRGILAWFDRHGLAGSEPPHEAEIAVPPVLWPFM